MTAHSALLTRLYARLGVSVASTAEEALCEEALNGALCWVAAKGAPQLRQVYSGYTLDTSSPTLTHTASTATVTLSSVNGVHPGDILHNTTTNKKYLLRTVTTSGATVNLGIPVVTSMTGDSATLYRRSLPLPHAGTVWAVWEADGAELKFDPLVSVRKQFDTGTATHFTQNFAETLDTSYLTLYPAPSTSTQYFILQGPSFAEDADIYASESVIQSVLAQAVKFRFMMSSQGGMAQMAAIMAEAMEPLRTATSSGTGMVTRT